jgi:antitoxin component YwqK of YwqJK toxin-antitoxin module
MQYFNRPKIITKAAFSMKQLFLYLHKKHIAMKHLILSFFIISLTVMVSCTSSGNKTPVTKTAKNDSIKVLKKHFNNNPSSPVEWVIPMKMDKDGKYVRNGVAVRYLKSGKKAEEIPYVMGKKEGTRLTYHSTGKVYKEQHYVNNKLNGICKRYDRQGKLTAEYPYKNGLPGTGLKEYTNLGKLRPDPVISITRKDEIKTSGKYRLIVTLTGKGASRIKSVKFYNGNLLEGKYFHKNLMPARMLSSKKGEFVFELRSGSILNTGLNIVADARTNTGMRLILQKPVKISVRGI